MNSRSTLLISLLLLSTLSGCSVPAGASPTASPTLSTKITPDTARRIPQQNDVRDLLVRLVDHEKRATAMVVGLLSSDPPERWTVGYGKLSANDPRTPDGDTVFEIASISKVFTGTLLALAVQNGEVRLDDPISQYLPPGVNAPAYDSRPITLLDLATHSSGLPHVPTNSHPADPGNPFADYTLDQMYAFLSGYHLTRQPGERYEYSNYGMSLLGNLLARAADQPDYETLLINRILDPLGMDSTRVQFTPDMVSRLAAPHNAQLRPVQNWDLPTFAGAGGIRSTADDLLTFLAANLGLTQTGLLPAVQLANTSQRPTDHSDTTIGLGWHLTQADSGVIHWHNGQTGGYHSYLAFIPERGIGVVVLANAEIYNDDLGLHLLDPANPLSPPQP